MEPGNLYHLYTHANGFENLFKSDENYSYFLQRYEHFIDPVADTLVYCLMPNHIHFLIQIKSEAEIESTFGKFVDSNIQNFKNLGGLEPLEKRISQQFEDSNLQGFKNLGGLEPIEKRISQQFSNLFNGYTKAFNKMYNRKGSLFIPNFKRKEISDDSYITNAICYIHCNPIYHGFVKNLADWPWSSYQLILVSCQETIVG
jgi:putative transposase